MLVAGGLSLPLAFQKQLQRLRRHRDRDEEEICEEVEDGGGAGKTEAGVVTFVLYMLLEIYRL